MALEQKLASMVSDVKVLNKNYRCVLKVMTFGTQINFCGIIIILQF